MRELIRFVIALIVVRLVLPEWKEERRMTQTEWIISLDDDLKDHDEIFVGNVRDGDRLTRCCDCIYYRHEIDMCDEPYSTAHNVVHEDDYCSKAERKKHENN